MRKNFHQHQLKLMAILNLSEEEMQVVLRAEMLSIGEKAGLNLMLQTRKIQTKQFNLGAAMSKNLHQDHLKPQLLNLQGLCWHRERMQRMLLLRGRQ